ncbi:MAG TPA: hypothetical protein PKA88_01685 [Polyangiaceae bacterium]|nr:hypothetical protein [Polyangiaceae bacterium]HMR74337.1 hypothetical protein [Polyangiaceae bacterium]
MIADVDSERLLCCAIAERRATAIELELDVQDFTCAIRRGICAASLDGAEGATAIVDWLYAAGMLGPVDREIVALAQTTPSCFSRRLLVDAAIRVRDAAQRRRLADELAAIAERLRSGAINYRQAQAELRGAA